MLLLQGFYWHLPFLQMKALQKSSPLEKLEEKLHLPVNYFHHADFRISEY